MDLFRKAFLFMVGTVAIAFEEAGKAIDEVAREIENSASRSLARNP